MLQQVRERLAEYYGEVAYEAFPFRVVETERARRIREETEGALASAHRVVRAAGVATGRLTPREDGRVVRVSVVRVAFAVQANHLSSEDVLAAIDAAIDRYARGRGAAWIRTLNPLYWFDRTLDGAVEAAIGLPYLRRGDASPDARRRLRSALRLLLLFFAFLSAVALAGWADDLVRLLPRSGS